MCRLLLTGRRQPHLGKISAHTEMVQTMIKKDHPLRGTQRKRSEIVLRPIHTEFPKKDRERLKTINVKYRSPRN